MAELVPTPRAFCWRRTKRNGNDPYNRTAACMRARLGECICQRTSGPPLYYHPEDRDASAAGEPGGGSPQVPTADDICRALEQSAAENALPVEFFARVIWQESRFDARAVSPKGAAGIAQFMPATASWHGLADPFDPMESLRHSAERPQHGPTNANSINSPVRVAESSSTGNSYRRGRFGLAWYGGNNDALKLLMSSV